MSLFYLTFCRVEMRWEAQHLPWMHDGDSYIHALGLIPLSAILIPAWFASLKPQRFQDCKADAAAERGVYCKFLVCVHGSSVHAYVVTEQLCKATRLGIRNVLPGKKSCCTKARTQLKGVRICHGEASTGTIKGKSAFAWKIWRLCTAFTDLQKELY